MFILEIPFVYCLHLMKSCVLLYHQLYYLFKLEKTWLSNSHICHDFIVLVEIYKINFTIPDIWHGIKSLIPGRS
jgi:hypothetical protein